MSSSRSLDLLYSKAGSIFAIAYHIGPVSMVRFENPGENGRVKLQLAAT